MGGDFSPCMGGRGMCFISMAYYAIDNSIKANCTQTVCCSQPWVMIFISKECARRDKRIRPPQRSGLGLPSVCVVVRAVCVCVYTMGGGG